MLTNTGTVSFILYGLFLVISIVFLFIAIYFIVKGKIEQGKLDRIIELFKYVIISAAITTVALMVTDLFKEREQDVKELEYFDKYVADVKKVDGILERLQLAKYLSIVAPSGEMKESWRSYCDTVRIEYKEYIKLKVDNLRNDSIKVKTDEQEIKDEQNQKRIKLYENPIENEISSAEKWESKGFLYLLNKDVENAIIAFRKSEDSNNGYHMVYDIAAYLTKNKEKLTDSKSEAWTMAFKEIARDFSWKMPTEIKNNLLRNAK